MNTFGQVVRRLLYSGASRADAEDAVQQAMAAVYERWSEIGEPDRFVHVVARHALIKMQSRAHREAQRWALQGGPFVVSEESGLDSAALEADAVRGLFALLTPMQRQVISLYYDGYPTNEIADSLNISQSTVRVHLQRARQILRKALSSVDG
ncbi:RNA polymerase sigma-E factor [Actinoplanes sp. SE50]|uniref:RNA polymerase sigma factor n=1 Tax=unclassified Actinoplanes TaxID=2626549 RepID=UPI00023EBF94|nr:MULTISPECIES: sigma-70 family RNA polymerase sigma factor [unclassified Actinoplanes]AEV86914.1 RNA polymerase sigma-E factor [Actinoplanes sp. SE50/110]ATO85311.1 RNA polymerase sigma-E factor [Actinoplanes sp. SE50]SLM02721.1 RNA polymerase sigma factor [Actinoplanes sp. SE50/110]